MAAANVRSDMTRTLSDAIADEKSGKEIIAELKEFVTKTGISEQEVAVLVRYLINRESTYVGKG